ncbi:DNA-packaging protein [Candidatus Nanosynbacter sp. HMT-352]|uniref:DNA-packaging protein n=1 Tax=Candidatus Nanosynbacter sp. HMT-352 TaxID=2899133 RepID=UPI001FB5BE6C|nr:DNA-packaging protein [Candidatus Nanosynbacter sp. HMT-352]UOG66436.1 DNA-packaging protein [Candidatus Nanosynbacter sp. HMT-352]
MATRKMMRRNRRSSKQANRKNSKQQLRGIVKDVPKTPPVEPPKQLEQPEPGQPTKYKPEYCQQLIDYFSIEPLDIVQDTEIKDPDGSKRISRRLPQRFPCFEGFARKIGVHRNTLKNWCAEHPEFAEAYDTAKDLQREFLVDIGLSGAASASFAIFTMKNVCGWRDERDLKLKKAKEEGNIDDEELRAAIFE